MAKSGDELTVLTKTYDLILWSCNHTSRFPRRIGGWLKPSPCAGLASFTPARSEYEHHPGHHQFGDSR